MSDRKDASERDMHPWKNANRNPQTFRFFSSPPFLFPLLFRPFPPPFSHGAVAKLKAPPLAQTLDQKETGCSSWTWAEAIKRALSRK
jgi:hypothetical protein